VTGTIEYGIFPSLFRKEINMSKRFLTAVLLTLACACAVQAQDINVAKQLEGFDDYMAKVLKD